MNCQSHADCNRNFPMAPCAPGATIIHCSTRAQASRPENAASDRTAIWRRTSGQLSSPRLYAATGSSAISADSSAMDIPLPVTGGVMVKASPMEHSSLVEARRGFNWIPATEQNDSGSNCPFDSRVRSNEPSCPSSQSAFDSVRCLSRRALNRPQTFTWPRSTRLAPT